MNGSDPLALERLRARAWSDEDYHARLLTQPRAALAEMGIELPESIEIQVLQDEVGLSTFVIPAPPPL